MALVNAAVTAASEKVQGRPSRLSDLAQKITTLRLGRRGGGRGGCAGNPGVVFNFSMTLDEKHYKAQTNLQ